MFKSVWNLPTSLHLCLYLSVSRETAAASRASRELKSRQMLSKPASVDLPKDPTRKIVFFLFCRWRN